MTETCPYCNGNDYEAPCAYPGERKPGCLRDQRLKDPAWWQWLRAALDDTGRDSNPR